jgi:hypothetical protein
MAWVPPQRPSEPTPPSEISTTSATRPDLFELPYHAPPRPTRDRDEAPPFDDIAQAWQDLTGEPYPGRERVLEPFDRARKAGRLREP